MSRPPRGFNPEHPLIEYIKMKQYLVGIEGKANKIIHTREILDYTIHLFKTMTPLINFINKGLGLK
ncbi:MAG: DUF2461 domain-containing protein [Patescibacteria group bacterium]|nr:DUF2461 domain-containing protein [Patescibacteria group bacterium]